MIPKDAKIAAWDRMYDGEHPRWRGPAVHDLAVPAGARALELGCGDGKTLRGLAGKGHGTVALDFSRKALISLGRRSIGEGEVLLVQGDGAALPFASESFQLVVAHHFFEHLEAEEMRSSASEAARVLSPGGRLSVRSFARQDLREGRGEKVGPSSFLREGILYHYFGEDELVDLFCGLSLDSVRTEVTTKRFAGELKSRAVVQAQFHKVL